MFEPNSGQFPAGVKFGARTKDHALLLREAGAELAIRGATAAVRLQLSGSNPTPAVEGLGLAASTSNYLVGDRREQWRTQIRQYERVLYRGVYPGIDLVYYGNARRLEFDFIVAPGSDPSRIRMKFTGARSVSLQESGDLLVRAGDAELVQARPVVYQERSGSAERTPVEAKYVMLRRGEVGFELGNYDRTRPLIIDPILYSTVIGGSNAEAGTAVGVDSLGRVWMAGHTWSAGLAQEGAFREEPFGGQDIFVARFDPTDSGGLSLAQVTYLGGTGNEEPKAMYIDSNDQVYIAGSTTSLDFALGGNAPQTGNAGERDAFVLRINPNEAPADSLIYSTYIGGTLVDVATAVVADDSGVIYVSGYTTSDDVQGVNDGVLQRSNRGGYDAFVAVLDPSRPASENIRYLTYLGGEVTDVATGIGVDADGIIFVTGNTYSWDFPTTDGAWRQGGIGGGDIFIARIDPSLPGLDALTYATYYGGTDLDVAYGMVLEPSGRLTLTGYTLSKDLHLTGGPIQRENAGDTDLFVAQFDVTRHPHEWLTFATYFGGAGTEVGYGLAVGAGGRIYVTGYTLSNDFPVSREAFQPSFTAAIDALLLVLEPVPAGGHTLAYASYLGGGGIDVGYGVAADAQGNAYVVGNTTTRAFPVEGNPWKANTEGLSEGFLSVFRIPGQ